MNNVPLTDAEIEALLASGLDCGFGGASIRSLLEEVKRGRETKKDLVSALKMFVLADFGQYRLSGRNLEHVGDLIKNAKNALARAEKESGS